MTDTVNKQRDALIAAEQALRIFHKYEEKPANLMEVYAQIDEALATPSTPVQGYRDEIPSWEEIAGIQEARALQAEAELSHLRQALSQPDIQPSAVHPWDLLERDGVKAVVELNVIYGEDFGGHEAMIRGVYGNFEPDAMGDFLKEHDNGIHLKHVYDAAGKDGDSWTVYAALEEVPEEKQYGSGYGDVLILPGYYHLGKVLGVVKHENPGINSTEDDHPGPSSSARSTGFKCSRCGSYIMVDDQGSRFRHVCTEEEETDA